MKNHSRATRWLIMLRSCKVDVTVIKIRSEDRRLREKEGEKTIGSSALRTLLHPPLLFGTERLVSSQYLTAVLLSSVSVEHDRKIL